MGVTVGLIDLDQTGFPNLALMKLSAWHKARGHQVTLLRGDRWLMNALMYDTLYASAVFTWNRAKAHAIAALGVTVGGSGVDLTNRLPDDVEAMAPDYTLYGIDYGLGYLMRGCIWTQETCPHCIVPIKEGKPREVSTIDALVNRASDRKRPFVVLLDNEFFWREKWAIARLEEFTAKGIDYCPSQGLDVRVLTPSLVDALAASPFWNLKRSRRQITFAFDSLAYERQYRRGVEMLLAKLAAWHLQSFVLVGFDPVTHQPRDLHADDERRIAIVRDYGIDPFVMVFRDQDSGQAPIYPELRHLARWVNRRIYKSCDFAEYRRAS